jgi:hypothetical protein
LSVYFFGGTQRVFRECFAFRYSVDPRSHVNLVV